MSLTQSSAESLVQQLADQIAAAYEQKTPLSICGNGTKNFYANHTSGDPVNIKKYSGVINYQPSELVITARAGTALHEINETLAEQHQMLAFEPPTYEQQATLGGTIASGFAGPRRAFTGAARDFILGCKIINGKGEVLRFGGEVIKNVAGYDVSRLMCGAFGTLGAVLEVSLKVLPQPATEQTRTLELDQANAIELLNKLGNKPLPLSASCWHDGVLSIRLSGTDTTVNTAAKKIGGETQADAAAFWQQLCEQTHDFFKTTDNIWRVSLPVTASNISDSFTANNELVEWYGGLHWIKTIMPADEMVALAEQFGGHAVLYRTQEENQCRLPPLSPAIKRLQQNLKQAFDPHNILNPGKLYADW